MPTPSVAWVMMTLFYALRATLASHLKLCEVLSDHSIAYSIATTRILPNLLNAQFSRPTPFCRKPDTHHFVASACCGDVDLSQGSVFIIR